MKKQLFLIAILLTFTDFMSARSKNFTNQSNHDVTVTISTKKIIRSKSILDRQSTSISYRGKIKSIKVKRNNYQLPEIVQNTGQSSFIIGPTQTT